MIDNRTYSTHYKKFSSEIPDYAKWYRPHDQPNMSDELQSLTLPVRDITAYCFFCSV